MVDVPTLAEAAAAAAPAAADTPADEPAPVTEVAVATPAPAEFSSEPAIIALPEIEEPQGSTSDNRSDREGRTYGARNAAARIILIAEENTWVQVRDKEENVVLTQMLQAGDRYLVPNRTGLRLMTGNAGGLDISVDGDSVPAIGEHGESRRDVRLDPDLLKTGAAVVR
jgi:cytoskeleton protein RodZ